MSGAGVLFRDKPSHPDVFDDGFYIMQVGIFTSRDWARTLLLLLPCCYRYIASRLVKRKTRLRQALRARELTLGW